MKEQFVWLVLLKCLLTWSDDDDEQDDEDDVGAGTTVLPTP